MRIYDTIDDTITEWSNQLRLRKAPTIKETLDIWSKTLTDRYGRRFLVKATPTETIEEWSRIL
jgi:hypothetical protein